MMKITILGCGCAEGVPLIGCECKVCRSKNPRNKRQRQSIYIESDGTRLLIDAGPDLRAQALQNKITRIDHILTTHAHADHVGGLADLRAFCMLSQASIDIWAQDCDLIEIRHRYGYLFNRSRVGADSYVHILKANTLVPGQKYKLGGINFEPFMQDHGGIPSLGFKFDGFVYSTDVKRFSSAAARIISETPLWFLDCTGHTRDYPAHTGLKEVLSLNAALKPKRMVLIHMSHEINYMTFPDMLPANVELAYDGMEIYTHHN